MIAMPKGNQYKCPNCDFTGRLNQIRRHLRENPGHWVVQCQECQASILKQKDIVLHEEETGHSTGLVPSDIINVQKTTKVSTGENVAQINKKTMTI